MGISGNIETKIEPKRGLKKALSVRDIMAKKYDVIPFTGEWLAAFGEPERTGTWLIWGKSGNGKSAFALQLCAELCKYGRVLYNSLEEGTRKTFAAKIATMFTEDNNKQFQVINESVEDLSTRLSRRRSADFAVIDSLQNSRIDYTEYLRLKKRHADKMLIFISHAAGSSPKGKIADAIRYDADQKIWVNGFKAITNGRSIGENGGTYVIWEEGARRVHGELGIKN